MINKYKIEIRNKIRRLTKQTLCVLVAAFFAFVSVLVWLPMHTEAYGQVTSRSVLMSSTQNAATNVAYKVSFTTVTNNQNMGSLVIEFCANSPIIGDTCTHPAGFLNTNYSSLTLNNVTGNITGLSVDTTNSTSNKVVLTRGSASTVANGAVTLTLGNGTSNGITNPNNGSATFYARIITFNSTDGSGDELNASLDAGGVAISTANQLSVTAKVQEALRFCVYTGIDCTAGGTGVTLGDVNGVLESNSTTYVSSAYYDVSSNAVAGVSIRLKGTTLKSGVFDIAPYGSSCTADSTTTSVEQFGLRMKTLGPTQVATAPYNCSSGSHGFDDNNTTGTTSIFGQEIAHTTGASDISTSEIEFAAKSANTSEAGVYNTVLTLIATATY